MPESLTPKAHACIRKRDTVLCAGLCFSPRLLSIHMSPLVVATPKPSPIGAGTEMPSTNSIDILALLNHLAERSINNSKIFSRHLPPVVPQGRNLNFLYFPVIRPSKASPSSTIALGQHSLPCLFSPPMFRSFTLPPFYHYIHYRTHTTICPEPRPLTHLLLQLHVQCTATAYSGALYYRCMFVMP